MEVSYRSYFKYLYYHKINLFILNFSLILFVAYELAMAYIIQVYSKYDEVQKGSSQQYENFSSFWLTLAILHLFVLVAIILKSFLLEMSVLKSN